MFTCTWELNHSINWCLLYLILVHISDIRDSASPGSTPVDSAFSQDEGAGDQTGNDVNSFILSVDSGKPVSPEGSTPFSMVPEGAAQGSSQDDIVDVYDWKLPTWLENVKLIDLHLSLQKYVLISYDKFKNNQGVELLSLIFNITQYLIRVF